MPIDLRDIAAISGMSGLYRMIKPTRNGVIVETLTATPTRTVAQARNRISLLHEISIYTNDEENTVPLADVFERVKEKFGNNLPFDDKPGNQELVTFMAAVVPDYDRERVYLSDIKKLITWYGIVSEHVPFTEAPAEEKGAKEGKEETKASKSKSKKADTAEEEEAEPAEKKAKKPAAKKATAKDETKTEEAPAKEKKAAAPKAKKTDKDDK